MKATPSHRYAGLARAGSGVAGRGGAGGQQPCLCLDWPLIMVRAEPLQPLDRRSSPDNIGHLMDIEAIVWLAGVLVPNDCRASF